MKKGQIAQEELRYLEESSKIVEQIQVPIKHTSYVVDYSKGKNQVHETNNEKSQSVIVNLINELRFSKNPYFNKKMYKTKHAEYMNAITLYKLG